MTRKPARLQETLYSTKDHKSCVYRAGAPAIELSCRLNELQGTRPLVSPPAAATRGIFQSMRPREDPVSVPWNRRSQSRSTARDAVVIYTTLLLAKRLLLSRGTRYIEDSRFLLSVSFPPNFPPSCHALREIKGSLVAPLAATNDPFDFINQSSEMFDFSSFLSWFNIWMMNWKIKGKNIFPCS